jgi:WD40 repeat protein
VAFSHDSKQIVSGSSDNTIRVWNADSGQAVSGPFDGNTDLARLVAVLTDCGKVNLGPFSGQEPSQ